jgi:diaminopimelate epimerase
MEFLKMHGLGNDFVIIDRRYKPVNLESEDIRLIGDRHLGVGFDQLVFIDPPAESPHDIEISFYNSDGSVAGACGNASRCVASLILEETGKPVIVMGSSAGALEASMDHNGLVTVMMPAPRTGWRDIPLARDVDTMNVPIDHPILANPVAVSMGNPHAVFFVEDLDSIDISVLGPEMEHHPMFPDRANIGFAQLIDEHTIRLRVFERGAGLTLACGSGACAALVAAVKRGLIKDRARLNLDGGVLEIVWPGEGPVAMTGPVALAFRGNWPDR